MVILNLGTVSMMPPAAAATAHAPEDGYDVENGDNNSADHKEDGYALRSNLFKATRNDMRNTDPINKPSATSAVCVHRMLIELPWYLLACPCSIDIVETWCCDHEDHETENPTKQCSH